MKRKTGRGKKYEANEGKIDMRRNVMNGEEERIGRGDTRKVKKKEGNREEGKKV